MLLACSWLAVACSDDSAGGRSGDSARAGTPSDPADRPAIDANISREGNVPNGDRTDPDYPVSGTANDDDDDDDDSSRRASGGRRGGGSSSRGVVREDLQGDTGPLSSAISIANDTSIFTLPRAAVAVGQQLAFVASDEGIAARDRAEVGARSAIFVQRGDGQRARRIFASPELVSPIDIDVSLDGRTLYVADFAGGKSGLGAIAVGALTGGAFEFVAEGFSPRSVTVAPSGDVLFSGIDPTSGRPGVFELDGGNVTPVFVGAPLIDPSGIAAFADDRLLVADTRAFDAVGVELGNEGSIVLIENGQATTFATGFATGFPAGIALTQDEGTLLVSAESADRHDVLLLVDVANPALAPKQVAASFSALQDAAGGLKRTHGRDEFSFASLAANGGGTVFRIE